MSHFSNAADDVIAERGELAVQVQRELELAGISAYRLVGTTERAGAEIEVDRGDDAAGGVFVTWKPHPTVSARAVESVRNGEYHARSIRHSGAIAMHMRDAVIGILVSAGFRAEASDDDMRPLAVRVRGGEG
ncbi:hypothetical protein EYS09_04530 [Streptomyces kasugaensis]|uniref:Uncharacterized protein n=1 Tax=Streptomyces kasugaensis TaxID=1946 RepID=A0A4Q9HZM9_STRKA|nr:hypothetical protein [Streptomyces kasugaensis]TBO60838.1 hypothetical protein EYS09_04530 [Streptomyces kasugaensis]